MSQSPAGVNRSTSCHFRLPLRLSRRSHHSFHRFCSVLLLLSFLSLRSANAFTLCCSRHCCSPSLFSARRSLSVVDRASCTMLFRASTILRTRGRKSSTDDIAGTVSTATRSRRTATKRSRSGATTRSTTRKRAPAKAASASSSRGGKGGRGRRASVNETAEPATEKGRAAHHGLINLIALAIKKVGRYSRNGVSRPKIHQWMEEHLVAHTARAMHARPAALTAHLPRRHTPLSHLVASIACADVSPRTR